MGRTMAPQAEDRGVSPTEDRLFLWEGRCPTRFRISLVAMWLPLAVDEGLRLGEGSTNTQCWPWWIWWRMDINVGFILL